MKLLKYVDDVTEIESCTLARAVRSHSFYFHDLNEIFDNRPSIFTSSSTDESFYCKFNANGSIYIFSAFLLPSDIWALMFYDREDSDSPSRIFTSKKDTTLSVVVFAGVLECLDKMMAQKTVNGFYFESTDDRLKKFYTKMVPYIKREYPKYSDFKTITSGQAKTFMFTLPDVSI